jgi:hypothetical protein
MKRFMKIAFAALVILMIPAAIVQAQDKKQQQHIKIVAADKSGTKVVIDTILNNSGKIDSIKLKDGKVIYIGKDDGMASAFAHAEGKEGHMIVTVSSDEKDGENVHKEIKIISGDSVKIVKNAGGEHIVISNGAIENLHKSHAEVISVEGGEKNTGKDVKIVIMKDGKQVTEGVGGDVMTWSSSSSSGNSKGEKYIYINEEKGSGKESDKVEKTNYVLAKDGMTITIEGNDEAKVKEMVNVVESKLGITKDEKGGKGELKEVKEETKKTIKK